MCESKADYQEKDALRDEELNSLGFTVIRFSNDEVMREIEAVVEQIYLFLENVRADLAEVKTEKYKR